MGGGHKFVTPNATKIYIVLPQQKNYTTENWESIGAFVCKDYECIAMPYIFVP